ncbi:MAG: redoxin family protein [Clostridia bacterium]|nr:redoxin family protein [Clostridia bacterium]
MKKIISVALLILMCCAPLCACSMDFSAEIDEAMDGLYDTLYNAFELFFKQPDVDDSDSDEGVTDGEKPNGGENQGGENSGSGESGEGDANENDNTSGDNTSGDNTSGDNTSGDGNGNVENPSEPPEESYEIGTQIGQKLPSYLVEMFDENGLSGECIDPSALGKVTVINFWGTWCPPCVGELPEFSEVATEYKDSVTIVAIHSVQNFSTSAVSHIKNNFADSDIIFAADEDLGAGNIYFDECYETFGGNGYYPYTIIIDENGVIYYAKEGALSKAALIAQIEKVLAK